MGESFRVGLASCQSTTMKKNVLTFRTPRFYSVEDEDVFFKWLYSMGAYKEVRGFGRELRLAQWSKGLHWYASVFGTRPVYRSKRVP